MSYEGERPHARLAAEKKLRTMGAATLREHVATRNAVSIDGLPVLDGTASAEDGAEPGGPGAGSRGE